KGCPPLSRMFPQHQSPWTPLSDSLSKSPPPSSVYDPSKQTSYFGQCFTNLGLLGRGSFGEVYKVSNVRIGGEYGPAADVFSLGVSILELACNLEVPNGGEGWQQLRQGHLPSEFTNGLSVELQSVLRMMLAPEPNERPTVSQLLALPCVRKRRWKRRIYLMVAETMLTLVSFCQFVVCFGCKLFPSVRLPFLPCWSKPEPCTPLKDSWDRDVTLSLSSLHNDPGSPEDD
ncbi:membrane-associated tyrosine- and threonine-specific cdc2-inhibitory kinase, partial [Poecilia reticulata]|uniref:membrane-associated tyrosine- and threonine-specific cdc2-inhibitory kinase n=1 Tax=Poecilia reticulata TaxID=8081 RepID=UPI0004A27B74